jgi:hypothetical protein
MKSASVLVLVVATIAVLCLLAPTAGANTVTFTFAGADSDATTIFYSASGGGGGRNQNNGAETALWLNSPTATYMQAGADLFKVTLPGDIAGATVNSATLYLKEQYWDVSLNVELRRINMPTGTSWAVGNGTSSNRTTGSDSGAGQFFANYDPTSGTGVTWLGTTVSGSTIEAAQSTYTLGNTPALGDLLSTVAVSAGQSFTCNLTTWAQNVANGTWNNDGFCLWAGNDGYSGNVVENFTINGMTLNYTPAPEPMTMGLLVIGGIATLLRRRRSA